LGLGNVDLSAVLAEIKKITVRPGVLDPDTNMRAAVTGALGVGSGFMVVNVLGLLGLAAGLPFGSPLFIGAAIGAFNAKMVRRQVLTSRGQQAARTAVNEAISTWAARTRTAIALESPKVRRQAFDALADLVQLRLDELNEQLATVTADAEAAKQSQARRVDFEATQGRIHQLRERTRDLGLLAQTGGGTAS
ncbi:MAG: hypothetical protein M3140_09300, partial [Actinomycetota bacterium]|nr:hypothetical protein [Actinomycetota bacterium]